MPGYAEAEEVETAGRESDVSLGWEGNMGTVRGMEGAYPMETMIS